MNISYVTVAYPVPSETFAQNDVKALQELGHKVEVMALRSQKSAWFTCLLHPVQFFVALIWLILTERRNAREFLAACYYLPASLTIFYQIKISSPQVVHLFWGHYPSIVGFLIKTFLKQTKVSLFLGAYDLEKKLGISSWMIRNCDALFTHSKANLPNLIRMGAKDHLVNIVHRGTNVERLLKLSTGVEKIPGRWLSAGRMLPSKGFDHVIKLFAQALKNQPHLYLVLAGDGEAKADLMNLVSSLGIEKNVKFLGFIPQTELIKEMATAEHFFLASAKAGERLPNVIKEAMLCGCICWSSSTPGIDELIENGQTGFVIDFTDYQSALTKLNHLTSEQKLVISNSAIQVIRNKFDSSMQMQRYLSIWENI